jgi:hypothetical protein
MERLWPAGNRSPVDLQSSHANEEEQAVDFVVPRRT